MFDFCNRVDGRKVNRKVLEALVKSGAFDGIAAEQRGHPRRASSARSTPAIERAAAQRQRERESGQTSLLSLLAAGRASNPAPQPVETSTTTTPKNGAPRELLAYEKESLGFYISGHPLDRFVGDMRRFANANTANCMERGPGGGGDHRRRGV